MHIVVPVEYRPMRRGHCYLRVSSAMSLIRQRNLTSFAMSTTMMVNQMSERCAADLIGQQATPGMLGMPHLPKHDTKGKHIACLAQLPV